MNKSLRTCIFLTAVFNLFSIACADYQEGVSATRSRDFRSAHKEFLSSATAGDERAAFELGRLYARGNGVPINYFVAHDWFLRAAILGHAEACRKISLMYASGDGVARNTDTSLMWQRRGDELAAGVPIERLRDPFTVVEKSSGALTHLQGPQTVSTLDTKTNRLDSLRMVTRGSSPNSLSKSSITLLVVVAAGLLVGYFWFLTRQVYESGLIIYWNLMDVFGSLATTVVAYVWYTDIGSFLPFALPVLYTIGVAAHLNESWLKGMLAVPARVFGSMLALLLLAGLVDTGEKKRRSSGGARTLLVLTLFVALYRFFVNGNRRTTPLVKVEI